MLSNSPSLGCQVPRSLCSGADGHWLLELSLVVGVGSPRPAILVFLEQPEGSLLELGSSSLGLSGSWRPVSPGGWWVGRRCLCSPLQGPSEAAGGGRPTGDWRGGAACTRITVIRFISTF